jgi:acyl carrier protein
MADSALREQVIRRLLAVSDVQVAEADVHDSTSLREDLGISSLILITLAAELEEALSIDFEDEELSHISTIGDLFEAIESSQQRSQST